MPAPQPAVTMAPPQPVAHGDVAPEQHAVPASAPHHDASHAGQAAAQPGGQTWPPSGSASWSATPPASQATDPLAIVALVAGLLWVVGLGSLVAIVCAIVVLRRGVQGTSRTLAFVGLGLGIVGLLPAVLVIAVAGAISLPVFLQQGEAALEAELHSDLRNAAITQETIFTSTRSYTADVQELDAQSSWGFGSDLTVVLASDMGYCMEASNASGVAHIGTPSVTPREGPCP